MLQSKLITKLTKEICDFWKKYPDAYFFEDSSFEEGLDVSPNGFLFEIIDEDKKSVGFLMLVKVDDVVQIDIKYDYNFEVEIGIFDHPKIKRSYATECLQNIDNLALSKIEERLPVVAFVRHENKRKSKMDKILLNSNFIKTDIAIEEGVLYVLKDSKVNTQEARQNFQY